MWVLLLLPALVSADLFGGPPLVSSPPPWQRVDHHQAPSDLFGATGFPFPTNVWWQSMALQGGADVSVVNPYLVKTTNFGLHVCLPDFYVGDRVYGSAFTDNLIMSTMEGPGSHALVSYDELSVTVGWDKMAAPIVRGMPYVTTFYSQATPSLR